MSRTFAADRLRKILDILSEEKLVRTEELASRLSVSIVTIRRDIKKLQDSGYVVNGYGFVRFLESGVSSEESWFTRRLSTNRTEKEKLAKEAVKFIEEGDTIFLDESTTCYVLTLLLVKKFKSLHIITNAVYTLLALSKSPGFTIESTGGSMLYGFNSLIGPRAEMTLKNMYASKFFFSCRAFKKDVGTFELSPFSASVKRIMLENSQENFLLVDHTKMNAISPFHCAKVQEIHNIITDKTSPELPYGKVKRIIIADDQRLFKK